MFGMDTARGKYILFNAGNTAKEVMTMIETTIKLYSTGAQIGQIVTTEPFDPQQIFIATPKCEAMSISIADDENDQPVKLQFHRYQFKT